MIQTQIILATSAFSFYLQSTHQIYNAITFYLGSKSREFEYWNIYCHAHMDLGTSVHNLEELIKIDVSITDE
jgi:hypothetical protein